MAVLVSIVFFVVNAVVPVAVLLDLVANVLQSDVTHVDWVVLSIMVAVVAEVLLRTDVHILQFVLELLGLAVSQLVVLVRLPSVEDLDGLDVLDSCELLAVILVATELVEVDALAKTLVLHFDNLEDILDLLAIKNILIVHSGNGVEDSPHNLRVINFT